MYILLVSSLLAQVPFLPPSSFWSYCVLVIIQGAERSCIPSILVTMDSRLRGQIQAVIMLLVEKQELCPLSIQRGQPWGTFGLPSLKRRVPRQEWINTGYKRKLYLGT